MFERDRRTFRRGGGILVLVGLPFLFAGLSFVTLPLLSGTRDPGVWVAPLFGLPFVAIGAGLVFGRVGVTIDRRSRTLTTWWGPMFPWKKKLYRFEDLRIATVTREIRRTKNSTYTSFVARIETRSGTILLQEFALFDNARRAAEAAAKIAGLALADRTGAKESIREAGTLDETFRDRARRLGQTFKPDPFPPSSRAKCARERGLTRIEIPPPGIETPRLIGLIAMAVIATVIYFIFVAPNGGEPSLPERGSPGPRDWTPTILFFAVAGGVILVGAANLVSSATIRESIEASLHGVKVVRRGLVLRRTRELRGDKIEEVVLQRRCVSVRSDERTIEIGSGLPDQELKWLCEAVCAALVS